jgi:putative ABC transport system substrate-binding protein
MGVGAERARCVSVGMRRRAFISLLGAAAAWPLAARAQQPALPVIGVLSTRVPDHSGHLVAAFRRGLAESSYVEGQNVSVEYRWALGQYDRLPVLAAELARRPVAVLVSTGAEPAAVAARAATATIPIVANFGADPVASGFVASLSRPGGNITGISNLTATLETKRLGLLRDLVPQAVAIGFLVNPNFPPAQSQSRDMQEAARAIGLHLHVLRASTDPEIDTAFGSIAQNRVPALSVAGDAFFNARRDKLVALYPFRETVLAGGLMSYGIDLADVWRHLGVYAGRVLKGAKPADLPLLQPTKFEFMTNLKTAKALGLSVPTSMQLLADEVIE